MSAGARYLLLSVTCFAVVNATVKGLSELPFQQIVFARGIVCLGIVLGSLRYLGISPWGHNKKLLFFRALAGTSALSCFFYSIHAMPLATAVTIQYLNPMFTVLLSGLFFGESVRLWHWFCTLIGFFGVFLIQGFDARVEAFDVGVGVFGAFSSAVAYNTVRSLRNSDHEQVVMFYFPLVACLLTAPWAVKSWLAPTLEQWGLLAVVGVMTHFGQLYLTRGYQAERASSVAIFHYVAVLYAILAGVIFFDESLPWTTWAGILTILASVILNRWPSLKGQVQHSD